MTDDTNAPARRRILEDALRAADENDLDERIGREAVARYEAHVAAAEIVASNVVTLWWLKQPTDVVEALLGELRDTVPDRVETIEERTGAAGAELLTELVRDDGERGGRHAYAHLVGGLLEGLRGTDVGALRDDDGDTPGPEIPAADPVTQALDGLTADTITERFGTGPGSTYAKRAAYGERGGAGWGSSSIALGPGAVTRHAADAALIDEWRRRPDGEHAIADIVATLENETTDAAGSTTGRPDATPAERLAAMLRDPASRERYERLVKRAADAVRTATTGGRNEPARAIARAVEGLTGDAISELFGRFAMERLDEHLAREKRIGAEAFITKWRRRPDGEKAIAEIVAALEADRPIAVAVATERSDPEPADRLVAILLDPNARRHYERLIKQLADTAPTTWD